MSDRKKILEDRYVGKTIIINEMVDEPQYTGKIGVVTLVDDMEQLHGTWGGLALNMNDNFEIYVQVRE